MNGNFYTNLDDFIGKYCGYEVKGYERLYGLDFKYHGKLYRITIEQIEPDDVRIQFESKLGKKLGPYEVALIDNSLGSEFKFREYNFIGWYDDIYDLLDNCYIEGKKFKEVILSPDFVAEGQD